MVGYALSAASDDSYENILITVIDAEDFAFADESADTAVYRYSRELRVAERVDKQDVTDNIPYRIIYDVASMLRKEEIKWGFPMALVWSYPEFGELELVSAEFQKIWPAVMFMTKNMDCTYINVTDAFFSKGIRPLHASFFCDVLNTVMFSMGVYIPEGFCSCFNSVFCDIRIFDVEKSLFKTKYLSSLIDINQIPGVRNLKYEKLRVKRHSSLNVLKKHTKTETADSNRNDIRSVLISVKRRCVKECLQTVYECLKRRSDAKLMYEKLNEYISRALKEITDMRGRLSSGYIINEQTDVYYMSFDDLLSALTFADERMDLKSVIRIVRRKNAIARKNPAPDAILSDGRLVHKNIQQNISI